MLDAIDDSFEAVEITNFLSIKRASVGLCNITAVIGPQASGKSVVAKLFYFGRTYLLRYFNSVYMQDYDTRGFKAEQLDDFIGLFGGLEGFDGKFKIEYTIGSYAVSVVRSAQGGKPKIKHSPEVDSVGGKLKREYTKFSKDAAEQNKNAGRSSYYEFRRHSSEIESFFRSIPGVLFIPASRSFYSTVSEELFTFLASDERVDPLTAQFGSFYEFAKRRITGDFYGASPSKKEILKTQNTIRPVLDGDFIRVKSRDFIQTGWGRVPLRSASSGQQEALPLLISLMEFPNRQQSSQLLVIEEPEAHLFPEAQKHILDLIVTTAIETQCDMLFTTHSPYVLACLNTHIARLQNEEETSIGRFTVEAYLSKAGSVKSIVDEDGLIDTNLLDEVSEEIAIEFLDAVK